RDLAWGKQPTPTPTPDALHQETEEVLRPLQQPPGPEEGPQQVPPAEPVPPTGPRSGPVPGAQGGQVPLKPGGKVEQQRMSPANAADFRNWARTKTVKDLRQLRDGHEDDPMPCSDHA